MPNDIPDWTDAAVISGSTTITAGTVAVSGIGATVTTQALQTYLGSVTTVNSSTIVQSFFAVPAGTHAIGILFDGTPLPDSFLCAVFGDNSRVMYGNYAKVPPATGTWGPNYNPAAIGNLWIVPFASIIDVGVWIQATEGGATGSTHIVKAFAIPETMAVTLTDPHQPVQPPIPASSLTYWLSVTSTRQNIIPAVSQQRIALKKFSITTAAAVSGNVVYLGPTGGGSPIWVVHTGQPIDQVFDFDDYAVTNDLGLDMWSTNAVGPVAAGTVTFTQAKY